ncbi:3-oxoacyl-[acyl-carrier-protein] reductase [bacterium]|nr:3-oxoacyl-[acyl-carrier-protein] reductase [bacterium]
MNLADKKVLVTGGSRGIGRGIVEELAQHGARVAFTYTSNPAPAEELVKSLSGEGHLAVKMDVRSQDSVSAGMAQVLESFGGLDGLVNNAGITKDQLVMRMSEEDFKEVIDTNLLGTFLCSKAVLKPMMKQRSGSIVNLSSVVAQMGNPGQANYVASKAGIEGLTRSMALEIASRKIRVNAVAPGFIATDMTEKLTQDQKDRIISNIPLASLGEPKDIAGAVAYLLSDMSRYITGQVLQVNGGLYL